MRKVLLLICLIVFICGCGEKVGDDRDEHGCIPSAGYSWCEPKQKCLRLWEEPCDSLITFKEAYAIAEQSSCMEEGQLTDTFVYNDVTQTFWIDMDLVKEGCSPACVVDENAKTAEINYRCTGLVNIEIPDSDLNKAKLAAMIYIGQMDVYHGADRLELKHFEKKECDGCYELEYEFVNNKGLTYEVIVKLENFEVAQVERAILT